MGGRTGRVNGAVKIPYRKWPGESEELLAFRWVEKKPKESDTRVDQKAARRLFEQNPIKFKARYEELRAEDVLARQKWEREKAGLSEPKVAPSESPTNSEVSGPDSAPDEPPDEGTEMALKACEKILRQLAEEARST